METTLHTGNMLKTHVKRRRISQSGWARQQGVSPDTIARYLRQPTMRIDTLLAISQTLNYNFLRHIANTLPPAMEPRQETNQQAEVAALQQQVQQLQTQVATLKEALSLVISRNG